MLRAGNIGERFFVLVCDNNAGTGSCPGGAGEKTGVCGVSAHCGKVTEQSHWRYVERQFEHVWIGE